jgi:hypothetical protein
MGQKEGLAGVYASIPSNNNSFNKLSVIGQVIGIVAGENLPTPTQYIRANKVIGSVIYAEVNTNGPLRITGSFNDELYNQYNIAKPFYSSLIDYPLKGELVWIKEDFPSANAEIEGTAISRYYIGTVNTWGSPQQNSVANYSLGATFVQNPDVKSLLPFDGDRIFQGRQGNALRFSSTTKLYNDKNEWSSVGSDTDPITILTNGFSYDPSGSLHIERINKDLSSLYLTSAQIIPLQPDKTGILNNKTTSIEVSKFSGAQVILNSDRIVLNSKKDDVLLFAKNNIQLSTKNIINLNADDRIHLNGNKVFLGPWDSTHTPQPLVLGNNTVTLLKDLINCLHKFGASVSSTVSTSEGTPLLDVNTAAKNLCSDLKKVTDELAGILSQQNYTV